MKKIIHNSIPFEVWKQNSWQSVMVFDYVAICFGIQTKVEVFWSDSELVHSCKHKVW